MKLLRFLYHTIPGRVLLRGLVSPGISRAGGRFLSSGVSRKLIPRYIEKNQINMDQVVIPQGGFSSFNAFFIRRRLQRLEPAFADDLLISPCDGLLTVIPISEGIRLKVKGTQYPLDRLLGDSRLAREFEEGTALIFRLTPRHYHRYCYSANGEFLHRRRIEGKLHCVRPVALERVPVFIENSREYQVLRICGDRTMIQMEVGALMVGKITNHPHREDRTVRAGEEKGYFEFGGSTIILLLPKGVLEPEPALSGEESRASEIPVRMGDPLGKIM